MRRPSDKLLKDLSDAELSFESGWHEAEADRLLEEAERLQSEAVEIGNGRSSQETLLLARAKEDEAVAHRRQSHLLSSVLAGRMPDNTTQPRPATSGSGV